MRVVVETRAAAATEELGARLAQRLAGGELIRLEGDLGAGKTCFVRGLARGLGVRSPITSPTYALMAEHAGRLTLRHCDAWMEGRERAFLQDGGAEWLDAGGVAAIEWGSRVADVLPASRLTVELAHAGATRRSIRVRVEGASESSAELARIIAALPAVPGLEEQA
jgi:tRNA threonylcarbamoyladenosine biosynthesis protein TsaE